MGGVERADGVDDVVEAQHRQSAAAGGGVGRERFGVAGEFEGVGDAGEPGDLGEIAGFVGGDAGLRRLAHGDRAPGAGRDGGECGGRDGLADVGGGAADEQDAHVVGLTSRRRRGRRRARW